MPRTERNLLLRIRWTPEKAQRVTEFVNEERKLPGLGLNNFIDGFQKVGDSIGWNGTPIVADPAERQNILKEMWYNESAPSGLTKVIKELNKDLPSLF